MAGNRPEPLTWPGGDSILPRSRHRPRSAGDTSLDHISGMPNRACRAAHGVAAMVPKLRTSPARKRKRRSHLALKRVQVSTCPLTGTPKLPHRASMESGFVRPGLTLQLKESE